MDKRIELLDLWRSLCVVLMVIYHLLYDLTVFDFIPSDFIMSGWGRFFAVSVSGSFVFIAGISSTLSRNNIRRGFYVLAAGLAVMLGAGMVGADIRFGVLQLLGLSMVFYGAAKDYLKKIPFRVAPVLWLSLAVGTWLWTSSVTTELKFLYPLGFVYDDFVSADYVPIFPWIFVFLMGTWIGEVTRKKRISRIYGLKMPAAVLWPGRHSLAVYIIHQPVIYAAVWAAARWG